MSANTLAWAAVELISCVLPLPAHVRPDVLTLLASERASGSDSDSDS
jgi:hypothetical protein